MEETKQPAPATGSELEPSHPAARTPQDGTPAVAPDTPAVEPGTPAVEPDTPTVESGTTAVEPGTPAVEPGTPAVEPGTTAVESGTPAVEPDTPAVEPGTPAVEPGTPAVEPDTPAVEPDTPAVEPGTTAVEPGTTAVEPGTTAVEPDTPAVESDIPAPAVAGAVEETTEDFAELLAETKSEPKMRWRRGEKIKARVVRVTGEWVFVSLGGKEEGSIRVTEFRPAEADEGEDEARPALPGEGDEVEAFVLSASGGEVALTTKLGRRDISLGSIEEAWRSGIPVEGRVAQTVKGGYEVRIAGLRAFCPLSQIDLRWPKTPEEYVGQTQSFKILEFKERGRNIIVSRRSLLEEERAKLREDLVARLVTGAVVQGQVRSVQNFGAFVDLGGVDALIPVSEMSWGRVENPADLLAEGQEVTAKVLTTDWERDRVSLSLRALMDDPWDTVPQKYQPGQRVVGRVARLVPFGAFVTLEPGVDGLVHISALGAGRRVNHPQEVLQHGEEIEVEIVSVEPDNRRISLSLEYRHLESLGGLPDPNDVLAGVVEKVADFGVFVKIPSGHTGLVPNVEMGTPKGTDHTQKFKPGDSMEVAVLSVDDGGKRIRLSRKGVTQSREAATVQEYRSAQVESTGSLGTFGDLLKGKLKQKG